MSVDEVVDVLGRRGSLDVFRALTGPALPEHALVVRLGHLGESVVIQRIADLRRLGAVEEIPESGDLRLSPEGRRLQGLLDQLERWATSR